MSSNDNKLLPAYLAVGEDALKRRTVIERLRRLIAQMGDLEFNHDRLDAERASGEEVVQACNTLPFASPLRLVEVHNIERLSKGDADLLVAYLSNPCSTTVLALSGSKLAKNTRLYKAISSIGKTAVIDCAPMKRYELIRALRGMAASHGFTLNESGATRLVELVGEDTVRLDSELRKLALGRAGADPVTQREVEALVVRTTEAKPWELVDAFSDRDLNRCLALLGIMESASPYALIGMCTARLRELSCAQSLAKRGDSHLLAETLKVPAWRVKNHLRWAEGFSEQELREAFSAARDCEKRMKSGTKPEAAFFDWLVETTVR